MSTIPEIEKRSQEERRQRISALGYDFEAQPKTRRKACNLCEGDLFTTISHRDRYGYPASASACLRCGLVFLDPVMTQEAYGRFYVDVYRPLVSAFHGRDINAETIQAEQGDYADDLADFLAADLEGAPLDTMLDIGGSTGIVAHRIARRFGLSGTLIDPAPLEVDVARQLGLETITGFVEDYQPGDRQFDFIMMCQTVDHLLNVSATLRKVRQIISGDGFFFVDIVDFRAAYLRNHSIEAAIKIDHPYYITESAMLFFLARAGFSVRRVTFASDHLHVGFLCKPDAPQPDVLPQEDEMRGFMREIRWVQNARAPRN